MLKQKTNLLLLTLFFLITAALVYSGTTILDSYDICRTIDITDQTNFSKPVKCVEPTREFLNTDEAVYVVAKLSLLEENDVVSYLVINPSGTNIIDDSVTVPINLSRRYDYREIKISSQSLPIGDYAVKISINGVEKASDSFKIIEDVPTQCETEGYYCCPSSKVCLSAIDGTCGTGETCCEDESSCKTYSPNYFSRTEITNCEEEEIQDCGRVVKLYKYNINAKIDPPQTGVMYYRGIDIDCGDKTDVAIAYYDEETGTWMEKVTNIEETEVEGSYKATALLDYLGYIALIRTDECVPTICTYGGYRTTPISASVNLGENITFELCGMIHGCEAMKDGICNKKCTEGIDLDCKECTNQQGDCCLISYDDKCDLDCGDNVDPDCCEKSKGLCCSGSPELSGSQGCDKNCGTSDTACTGCTPNAGDCCKGDKDGTCDTDCPKLSNGVGYVDVDCCAPNNVAITSAKGDCCKAACDGVCDADCIIGLDPDCSGKGCCGDGTCDSKEDCSGCEADCGACSSGGDYGDDDDGGDNIGTESTESSESTDSGTDTEGTESGTA